MKSWKKFRFSMPHVFTMLVGILVILGILSLILSYANVGFSENKEVDKSVSVNFNEQASYKNSSTLIDERVEEKVAAKIKEKVAAKTGSVLTAKERADITSEVIKALVDERFSAAETFKNQVINFYQVVDTKVSKLDAEGKLKKNPALTVSLLAFKGDSKFSDLKTFKTKLETDFKVLESAKKTFAEQTTLTKTLTTSFFNSLDGLLATSYESAKLTLLTESAKLSSSYIDGTTANDVTTYQLKQKDGNVTVLLANDSPSELTLKHSAMEKEETKILGSGVLDWFTAIPFGIKDAFWIIVFLFVLGGFINVVIKSQALEALIGKISKKFHADYKDVKYESFLTGGKSQMSAKAGYYFASFKEAVRQTWVIIPLMLFFSFAGTTYGMAEESLAFYAIIIPLALAAGFDVYTGFLIIFVGAGVGVMGSTINPFSILAAVKATADEGVGVKPGDGAAWRWVAWTFFTIVTIGFVMWYAARVKKDKNKSYLKDLFAIHKQTFQQAKVGELAPVLTRRRLTTAIIFMFTFVFMVFAMLNYDLMETVKDFPLETAELETFGDKKGTSWFHNSSITNSMGKGDPNANWPFWAFGAWYFPSLTAYFLIISLVLAAINWRGEKAYMSDMTEGAKDMMGVALAVGVARAISVLLKHTNMQKYFVRELSEVIKDSKGDKNITIPLVSYIVFIPLTFLIPSTSGLAGASFPILGPAVNNVDPSAVSGTITAYGWAAGWANMLVPTYGVVIGALAVTKIPYNMFLKAIWKYLLIMFLVGFFMVIIGGAAGSSVF